jgi:hypothetical protein
MNIDTNYIQNLHIALTALAAVHTGRSTELVSYSVSLVSAGSAIENWRRLNCFFNLIKHDDVKEYGRMAIQLHIYLRR